MRGDVASLAPRCPGGEADAAEEEPDQVDHHDVSSSSVEVLVPNVSVHCACVKHYMRYRQKERRGHTYCN